jgi:hypothetical protein
LIFILLSEFDTDDAFADTHLPSKFRLEEIEKTAALEIRWRFGDKQFTAKFFFHCPALIREVQEFRGQLRRVYACATPTTIKVIRFRFARDKAAVNVEGWATRLCQTIQRRFEANQEPLPSRGKAVG